jgi:NADPH2:quinone reductase
MRRYGPPEVLELESVELPPLLPREVRIRSLASAVNHSDLRIRSGEWPVLGVEDPFPYTPGLEVVGDVVEVGSEVASLATGARAITMMQGLGGVRPRHPGGYAEFVTADADAVATFSDELEAIHVAALGLAAMTAREGLRPLGPVEGLRVLVTGASGGVGSAAVALFSAQGAEVIGVVARAERAEYVRSLGAAQVVVAGEGSLVDAVGKRSIDRVLDNVGGALFRELVETLRTGGALSLVGAVAGNDLRLDAWNLVRPVTLTGYTSHALDGATLQAGMDELGELLRSGRLTPPTQTVLPLEEAAQAHRLLEEHGVVGRVLLVPRAPMARRGGS